MMSLQAWITLAITLGAAILLISEKLRPDLVALLVLAVLGLSGIVTPAETFAGFSGTAVMTIIGISIISEGLRQTGVTRSLGRLMYRMAGSSNTRLVLVVTLVAAVLSLVMNNIAAVGVLLPAALTLARRGRISPSRLLMPLAYGVLLGGMATLLTTANLIVSGALKDAGYQPFDLLDFFPVGAPIVLAGTIYLLVLGRKLLPDRLPPGSHLPQQVHAALAHLYGLEQTIHEMQVLPGSPMAGVTIRTGKWEQTAGVRILRIMRGSTTILSPHPDELIFEGDRILVLGAQDSILAGRLGLRPIPGRHSSEEITDAGTTLVELVVTPHGSLAGSSLERADFRERYNVNVLGIWREGKPNTSALGSIKLRPGDALLVQGTAERIAKLQTNRDLILLEEDPEVVPRPQKFTLALAITLVTLVTAGLDLLPIAVIVFGGAVLLLLTGCMNLDDMYQSVEWKAIFLIAGMWPLSTAIRTTGLADQAITSLLSLVGPASGWVIALALLLLALLLTQITGGQVAALILAPLAIATATRLGYEPHALAMAAALGCSLSFPTPFGHPVNIMVMSAGGYTFRDYVRAGLPLTFLVIALILVGLRVFMGL